ncbi:ABC-type molybdenum transport system, ATPase component/photorepair protein PhrA [Frankia casuarinae]|nr:ABC-type molybdenum transport system, ATPase component/photorepair protein PhrA [Frankia sp. CcI6]EYT92702.1 ABC-type molybdenum transport system, ATPase component/photorepair protein PhrA [Frankia casuarinae]KDA43637.1 ABC-type molybdenum transport system, ATPase component/photorepair protein PhrA [Frankia sp. BMG5.23]KEZ36945.1 ABC-type molybdenum transport system, ATPase component/photorepair protein PhrA [Frankia sp. CeD]KFB05102.1 ABC-type molybdenum transport system, ATPase component/p
MSRNVSCMPDAVLRLDNVNVVRDGSYLLRNVSWAVFPGQRWVVLGPNGAGKTTLLQVASGRLFPTRGTVDLLGARLGKVNLLDLRYRVGVVSPALVETPPADERVLDAVVTAGWSVLGRADEEYDEVDLTRAAGLLTQFGCRGLVDRRFGTLSEGERKRVLIARALMTDPELLLLDEPASGLDLGAREALMRRLTRFAADPIAPVLVLVSHHVEEIPVGVTHALLVRGGQALAAGPVAQVLTAQALSSCFGIPLEVGVAAGRYTARLAAGPPPRHPVSASV